MATATRPPASRRWWVAAVAPVVLIALVLVARRSDSAVRPETVVPFRLASVADGGAPLVVPGRPGRPLVLNFFGSWCAPCRAELPLLQEASRRAAGKVDVAGVDMQDGQTAALQLLAETGVTFPTGADPDLKVTNQYHVRGGPTTFFVARGGRVLGVKRGPLTADELQGWFDRLERT
ncbi:MAG TPA: TlpA disulfide reductase family protein [Acidimicrobiales bacterium]|nr:TlpA disulfide reductase family protein [Acidimicrobiales bacterium]